MKTFIWNSEYEVYVACAEKVEWARELLIAKFVENARATLLTAAEMINPVPPIGYVPNSVLYNATAALLNMPDFYRVILKSPDYILEDKECHIYNHSNE